MHWRERPTGQHIELGIAEVNLVESARRAGRDLESLGRPLIPIGVIYDPFVERALEPWSFGIYAGGQSILVGTPSGVTLAPEGGAHQSIKTPSIGLEQPDCISYEPAFVIDVEWTLLAAMGQLGRRGWQVRLSAAVDATARPEARRSARRPAARERRRRQVVAGAYLLRDAPTPAARSSQWERWCPRRSLRPIGSHARDRSRVICVTSPGLLFEAMQARHGLGDAADWILDQVFPADRRCRW